MHLAPYEKKLLRDDTLICTLRIDKTSVPVEKVGLKRVDNSFIFQCVHLIYTAVDFHEQSCPQLLWGQNEIITHHHIEWTPSNHIDFRRIGWLLYQFTQIPLGLLSGITVTS